MKIVTSVLSALFVLGLAGSALAGGDCCKEAKMANGWCGECDYGFAFGTKITSAKLHKALAGEKVNADAIECPGCKKAAHDNGTCDHCHVYFNNGVVYHSQVSQILAKGVATDMAKTTCEGCTMAAKTNGWCDDCNVGIVSGYAYKDKKDFKAAGHAHKVLMAATEASAKCEACAVAMVTDGTCESCKVSFKHGQMVKG
jgi:hypothetical protein